MKIAVGACTYWESHSPKQVLRHTLDWDLQADKRAVLTYLHDGPIDPVWFDFTVNSLINHTSLGKEYGVIRDFPIRRKFWGAYNRRDWLDRLDTEEYPYVFFCCADDQISPKFVQVVLAQFEQDPNLAAVGVGLSHHHYGGRPIPLGTYPSVNRSDWASFVWRSDIAKKVGINFPEEYAADGLFHQECFSSIGNDDSRIKILDSILVFKN